MSKTIVIASGKGGTGKTMIASNLGAALAKRGNKVILIDMDMGLRNLDLYLGLENNVVYDVSDVLNGICRIKQAIIKVKSCPGLFFMPASPKEGDGELTPLHMKVLSEKLNGVFDYVIIDGPAGMDDNLSIALGGCDKAVLVVTPEYASLRDSSAMTIYLKNQGVNDINYILNRVDLELMNAGYTASLSDIPMNIKNKLIGIVEESRDIRISTNVGMPVSLMGESALLNNFLKIAERLENN